MHAAILVKSIFFFFFSCTCNRASSPLTRGTEFARGFYFAYLGIMDRNTNPRFYIL